MGFTFEIILSIISFYYGSYLDNVPLLKLIVLDSGHFSLFIIMASLLIFTGFSYLNINMNCSKIANKTFLIYLIHPFVLYFFEYIIKTKIGIGINLLIAIPVELILVFVISYILSNLYSIFMKIINKSNCIGNFIIKILKLDI